MRRRSWATPSSVIPAIRTTYIFSLVDRLSLDRTSSAPDITAAVEAWVDQRVPKTWRDAARRGGRSAIREVRSRAEYEDWYPTFADSGLVVATWPIEYGGLDLTPQQGRVAEQILAPY